MTQSRLNDGFFSYTLRGDCMKNRIYDLREKQVISLADGCLLGNVSDVEIDVENGKLTALVVVGRKSVGLFGKEEEFVVSWDDIEKIGDDVIIVRPQYSIRRRN